MIPEYLLEFSGQLDLAGLQQILAEKKAQSLRPEYDKYRQLPAPPVAAAYVGSENGKVVIGRPEEVSEEEREQIRQSLAAFIPWRKGPFSVFGLEVDAEWRSDIKWQRILPFLGEVQDQTVLDIGCNNGYFLFRLAEQKPYLALGIDPTQRFKFNFDYLQKFARQPNLQFELLGFEHLPLFGELFDLVLCMGIVYHHKNPLEVLQNARAVMKKGARIIVDSIVLPGSEPVALCPPGKYANMANVWFVPSVTTLHTWLKSSGFSDIELIYAGQLTSVEQRKTDWSPFHSLEDALDRQNPELTVEGHPAPWRAYFSARKG